MEKEIRKNLQKNLKFNPFHNQFDFDFVIKYVKENFSYEENSKDEKMLTTCLLTFYINPIYTESYKNLKRYIETSNLSIQEILFFSIVAINRNYILIHQKLLKSFFSENGFDFLNPFRHKIMPFHSSFGEVDTMAAAESDLDNLMIVLNYLRYFEGKTFKNQNSELSEIESVNNIIKIMLTGSYLNVIKESYEDAIWNNGFINLNQEQSRIIIDYFSHDELKLLKTGHVRLLRNSLVTYNAYKDFIKNQPFINPCQKFKRESRIKSNKIKRGYITYELENGVDKNETNIELVLLSELITYYPFIKNQSLPNSPGLDLIKSLSIFSAIRYLIENLLDSFDYTNSSIKNINDFYKFPFRIKCTNLKRYLLIKLKFTEVQVDYFLTMLASDFNTNNRMNLWDKPLLKYNDDYLIPLLGNTNSITTHLLDVWLNEGGFSLDKRGHLLENYLKVQLSFHIKEKGFFYYIPQKSMFKINGKGKEEIDLLVNLKNCLIIAEVKCIKYPMQIRDFHNAYKRLMKASLQVERKADFITKNEEYFEKELKGIENKKIVKLIVTNFPNFSGFIINGIPVIDLFLLEAYVIEGKLTKQKFNSNENQDLFLGDVETTNNFYSDEDSFSNNFESKMKNPAAIEEIKSKIELKQNKLSFDGGEFDLYAYGSNFLS